MSTNCVPSFEEIALADGMSAWSAAVEGLFDWGTSALSRGSAVDLLDDWVRWWDVINDRGRPSWSSPNEVIFEAPVARLRDFSSPGAKGTPTLVLPPQAGHDSCIVDFSPQQSQMGAIREAGLQRAYSLDWIGATAETRDAGIEDYLAVIGRAVDHVGGKVNLIGDCQGGWLAAIYAALHPEQINTLTLAGAPIDFHCGEPVIHAALRSLAPGGNLAFYRGLVAAGGGVLRGEDMLAGFIAIKPENEVGRQMQLLAHITDDEHVDRYREFENWFKHTQAIPGDFYLWIVEHLFRDNELIDGNLTIAGERVDLGKIKCPLNLLAGAADHITPPDQVFAVADYAGTPARKVVRATATGGHLGLFMGREALTEHWPPLLAAVRAQSE
jgi:poly(3-hydroxybutyrate) depolymerase